MKFRNFTIENYRAINQADVPVGNNLIPLIGINESGKTSLLQAILAFDKFSDKYAGGTHLEYRNKYGIGDHACTISAEIQIDSESDLDRLSEKLNLTRSNPLLQTFASAHSTGQTFKLHRHLSDSNRPYSISGLSIPDDKNSRVARYVYQILPFLLYFDDFTERVPDQIEYHPTDTGHKLRNTKLGEWDRILREIFKRATDGKYELSDFISMADPDERDGLLSDINDVLNREVISAWKQLKSLGGNLADDQIDLELHLRYSTEGRIFRFEFKVSDRSTEKTRYFNIADRSKGFQWFFNFQTKLRFNPKYQDTQSGAIYLLDEPGSYLHSSAQEELLQTLQHISETNTILYCTHSQHLLDPDRINISQTRIVSREKGEIKVFPFGSAKGNKYQGALTPLYDALHLKSGPFNHEIRKAVITEGITDYYFFRMLLDHHKDWDFSSITVIPGSGAGNLKELISLAITHCESYRVLLDSDQAGNEAYERYVRFFGHKEESNLIRYVTPTVKEDVTLEDFLSNGDKSRLEEATGSHDPKRSIAELYYSKKKKKKDFWKDLDSESCANLSIMKERFKQLNSK